MGVVSLAYFIFLLILTIIYWLVSAPAIKKGLLLLGSAVFIGCFNWLSLLFAVVICVVNFFLLNGLHSSSDPVKKKRLYYTGILFNAILLFFYKLVQVAIAGKYVNVAASFSNNWAIVGLAFYVLQVIGYYFDVYKKRVPFRYDFIDFALSLFFFAKLSSGPILKMNESIYKEVYLTKQSIEANITAGLQRILLGVFKKKALADRLGPYVSEAFDEHRYNNGITIYLAPILFTIQLYLDFSAYMDIAVGSARMFGITLPENFHLPLRSQSITQFWRRWHITLVNWLTNYIFLPLSFRYRKLKNKGLAIAIVCTFLVSAAWHGLGVTFFIWAFCHFSYIIIENLFFKHPHQGSTKSGFIAFLQIILVWHLVALGNIFFRAHSLKDAVQLFTDLKTLPFLYTAIDFKTWLINGGGDIELTFNYRLSFMLAFLFLLFERKLNQYANAEKYSVMYVTLMIVFTAVFGMFDIGEQFLYLQF